MTIPTAGTPEPGVCRLPIITGDPVSAAIRLYTTSDGGVTKDYLDLSGYTGRAQVRRNRGLLLELGVTVADPQTGDDLGRLTVTADDSDTTDLVPGPATWDLELTVDGVRRTWLRGPAPVTDDESKVLP